MSKVSIEFLKQDLTTVRIPKKLSSLIDAYKLFKYPNTDKEKIIADILRKHLRQFQAELNKIKKF